MPGGGWSLAVPAGPPGSSLHVTLLYVSKPTQALVSQVCTEYASYVKAHVPPNEQKRHMLQYTKGDMWGKNSMLLQGRLATFHERLDAHMRELFPPDTFADKRETHVDVKGNASAPLYPEFNAFDAKSNTAPSKPSSA